MDIDLEKLNKQLRGQAPEAIIRWALSLDKRVFATTSFSADSAVLLDLLCKVDASVPVVWVDSGYNVRDAYRVADQLMRELPLNMHIYTPLVSAERRAALGGVPSSDEEEAFARFKNEVKLEPFQRALNDLQPEVWITGIRREETAHRQSLDIVSWDERGILKVAPIFEWSQKKVEGYRRENQLPSPAHYFDPTKIDEHSECGLHTTSLIAV